MKTVIEGRIMEDNLCTNHLGTTQEQRFYHSVVGEYNLLKSQYKYECMTRTVKKPVTDVLNELDSFFNYKVVSYSDNQWLLRSDTKVKSISSYTT